MRPRQGLELRPARRLLRLLHLTREHAAAVAFRPISIGNRGYMDERVRDLRLLSDDLRASSAQANAEWRRCALDLAASAGALTTEHSKDSFTNVVDDCDRTGYREFWNRDAPVLPAPDAPLLRRAYRSVSISFGPALGLGDEIACAELVRRIDGAYPDAELSIQSYYPAFWRGRVARASCSALQGRPEAVYGPADGGGASSGRRLAIFVNFGGLDFHRAFLERPDGPDAVEIAIGKGELRCVLAGERAVRCAVALDSLWPNHYDALRELGCRLLGPAEGRLEPRAAGRRRARGAAFKLLLNPLTSKPIVLKPRDWAEITASLHRRIGGRTECSVVPGLTESSAEYAREVAAETSAFGAHGLSASLLGGGSAAGPDAAFSEVAGALEGADMLLGVDTYTSHLAGLLRVPSLALCNWRTAPFWPDAPWTLWVEMRHGAEFAADAALALARLGTRAGGAAAWKPAALAFVDAARTEPGSAFEAGDAAWRAAPAEVRRVSSEADGGYAWPSLRQAVARRDEPQARWALDVVRHTQFGRMCALASGRGFR